MGLDAGCSGQSDAAPAILQVSVRVEFLIQAIGLSLPPNVTVLAQITVGHNTEDTDPGNNNFEFVLRVVPSADASTRM